MSSVHFLNVGKGDCTLIRHNSGHNSLIDICKGNYSPPVEASEDKILNEWYAKSEAAKGNFGMSKKPTNPISYLQAIGVSSLFRFILTHPDMDHLDGFEALLDNFSIGNYWDSGVRKEKPDFGESIAYKEEDWDNYVEVASGKDEDIKVIKLHAGARFIYANKAQEGKTTHDGLYILAPDKDLVKLANEGGDINDASYVLLFRSAGGRILIPGDAHDETWDYVIEHYKTDVENCSILFAPHHGRKSARNFEFLDIVKPKLTFFGCASAGHLAYNAWSSRELPVITNNQAGNIVMECANGAIDIYIENLAFAKASGCDMDRKNSNGYIYFDSIAETKEVKS